MRGCKRFGLRLPWFPFWFTMIWALAMTPLEVEADVAARPAQLQDAVRIDLRFPAAASDSTLQCFDGTQFALLNPGCFVTSSPSQSGDCTSSNSQFLVQYLFPDPAVPLQLRGFGFLSNDKDTTFPSAGALLIPVENGNLRFPSAGEIAHLAARNVRSPGDTTQVFVDLRGENLVIEPGANAALVLVLQFPASGQLSAPTQGPGIAAEASPPDEGCDFFTVDGGQSGVWFAPTYDPQNPNSLPLEWGFVAAFDPVPLAVESISWSHVKHLYRVP